ncbi:MAG: dipeptidase [Candidatus Acidiferrales bacterium]
MTSTPTPISASGAAIDFNRKSVLVDLHHDIAEDVIRRRQLGEQDILRRIWLRRLTNAGIKIQVFPIFIDSVFLPEMGLRRELTMIHYLLEEFERNADDVVLARNFADIEAGLSSNKLVAVLALEGAEAIDPELTILGILFRLGVRMASLTWNRRTLFADGADKRCGGAGLTKFGADLVHKMEELGILVDVSHLSDASFWTLLEEARNPIIASHSNARALCDHPRNLTDDQIRAIGERKGLIGVFIHPAVIDPSKPTISRVVDHIEHLIDVAGVDHVGVGTDFIKDLCGIGQTPTHEWLMPPEMAFSTISGLSESTDLPNLTDELLRRGFGSKNIQKILGENALRVFREVWND